MHFGCYSLAAIQEQPDLLYTIGETTEHDGVLGEIIQSFGLPVPAQLTSESLGEVIHKVAPHKTLQDNIAEARKYLGEGAFDICTDWLQRTHAMAALHGSFCDPTVAAPQQVNTLVFSGGVANWMERRLARAKQVKARHVGQVLLPVGNRAMNPSEHAQVDDFVATYDRRPLEAEYMEQFIAPALKTAGFGVIRVIPVESGDSSQILDTLFRQFPELLEPDHQTLVIGNAPSTIQAAGQFRSAARKVDKSYDYRGSQLFVASDTFLIGVDGQPTWQAQNPVSGIGQLLRNFKILLENAEPAA